MSGHDAEERRRRAVYRYGVVLLMLTAAMIVAILAPPTAWGRFLSILLQLAAVAAALSRAGVSRRLFGTAVAVAVIAAVSGIADLIYGGRFALGISQLAAAALLALVPVAILVEFMRDFNVTVQSVMAALCIYLVFGMFFASIAYAVSTLGGAPYFAGKSTANSSDYLYFSYITLATVGYGDYVPALPAGRALAVIEALTGQLYLVTVVALLVANLSGRRSSNGSNQGG
jgi:voltage-gated potassium channel Kch